jgi:hypothetical protein
MGSALSRKSGGFALAFGKWDSRLRGNDAFLYKNSRLFSGKGDLFCENRGLSAGKNGSQNGVMPAKAGIPFSSRKKEGGGAENRLCRKAA